MLLTQAATMGSSYACYVLALAYDDQMDFQLAKDRECARYWAKKALDDARFPMSEEVKRASCRRLATDE